MERRKFLQSGSLLAASGFLSPALPVIAGPFKTTDFPAHVFPADKKLDPAWLKSLMERGRPTLYRKSRNELKYIGMPVGGICAGGVYVGGDGRLWLWDIFNQNQLGAAFKKLPVPLPGFGLKEINNMAGSLYLEPLEQTSPLQQGFALSVTFGGTTYVRPLAETNWAEVTFEATYPVATIQYSDPNFPVEVTLQAYAPFIPGNEKDSGLPATIQSISIKNTSDDVLKVEIIGWLENKILLYSPANDENFSRSNVTMNQNSVGGISLRCAVVDEALKNAADYGGLFFGCMGSEAEYFEDAASSSQERAMMIRDLTNPEKNAPLAGIICESSLAPGESLQRDFILSWYMPNTCFYCTPDGKKGNPRGMTVEDADHPYYTTLFSNADEVAAYLAADFNRLKEQTFLWKETWYNSSLPHWFLERTFLNISTLATTVTHRFQSGRYYAWEGVGCCHGNCTHVYQYAHAVSRIFPALERDTRERVDLGIGFDPESGMIRIRGEKTGPSIDGQAGTLLRIYREHQMSPDDSFLQRNWPKIKKAVEFLMKQDKNGDGMEDTPMENTLDALWHGEISWIVGLCIAGVRAGQAMAEEMGDTEFAGRCQSYVEKGRRNMEEQLFNGEYFIHRPDPATGKKEIGSFNTCHIDQVYGQSWAWQVNLGRILDRDKTLSALRALWKYNYMPDVGTYIKKHPGGRFYALAGEGGMVMNTNPSGEENPYGNAKAWQLGYFNECMSGFEYQVAAHLMAEGMLSESLVLTRSIHDRYHAYKRNPFNEIECSDHYGRAMASYGVFISACGFQYHGPKGIIGFDPRISPDDFKAPFTAANGWGTYRQTRKKNSFEADLSLKYGELALQQIGVSLRSSQHAREVVLSLDGNKVAATMELQGNSCEVILKDRLLMQAGQMMQIRIS